MALKKRRDGLVTADAPTTTTPFDVQAFIRDKNREMPGFAAAVEAELASLRLDERLRELRKSRALTQAELAKRMGVTQGAVAQMENAESGRLEIRTLAKMATALGYALRIDFEPELAVVQVQARATPTRARAAKKR